MCDKIIIMQAMILKVYPKMKRIENQTKIINILYK
jgi:hypothetical protein